MRHDRVLARVGYGGGVGGPSVGADTEHPPNPKTSRSLTASCRQEFDEGSPWQMAISQLYSPASLRVYVYSTSFVQVTSPGRGSIPTLPTLTEKYSSSARVLNQVHLKATLQPMMDTGSKTGG